MKKTYLPERFAERTLFFSSFEENFSIKTVSGMQVSVVDGPDDVWIGKPHTGISGAHTLLVEGSSTVGKASVTLFDSLNVTVSEDTVFTYHIFPYFSGEHYDYQYSQMYFALGIYFTDGTRASLVDQNGNASSEHFGADTVNLACKRVAFMCAFCKEFCRDLRA